MLWEVQSESTVKGFGDVSLGDSASVAAELADSLVAPALWFILSTLEAIRSGFLRESAKDWPVNSSDTRAESPVRRCR